MINSEFDNIIDIGTSTPTLVRIDVKGGNIWGRMLQKLRLKPKKKVLKIYPITLRSRMKYSKYANKGKKYLDTLNGGKLDILSIDPFHNLVVEEISEDIIKAIAVVIHNEKSEPPKWLIDAIRDFNQAELNVIVDIMKKQLDIEGFLSSIISMTGMSLQANEIIAFDDSISTNSKETSSNIGG